MKFVIAAALVATLTPAGFAHASKPDPYYHSPNSRITHHGPRHAHGGRARVIREQTRPRGIHPPVQTLKMLQRPHLLIARRGIRIVKNAVRRRERRPLHLLTKIAQV